MDEKRVIRIFARLAAIYGHRWTSQHDDDRAAAMAVKVWREGLDDLSDAAIKAGIDRCVSEGEEWPPSLPTFRKMCETATLESAERVRQRSGVPEYLLEHTPLDERKGEGYAEFKEALAKLARGRTTKEAGGDEARIEHAKRIGRQADEVMP